MFLEQIAIIINLIETEDIFITVHAVGLCLWTVTSTQLGSSQTTPTERIWILFSFQNISCMGWGLRLIDLNVASVLNVSFNVKRLYKTRLNCTAKSSWRQVNNGPVSMLLSFFENILSFYTPFPSTACQLHANNLSDLSRKAFYM